MRTQYVMYVLISYQHFVIPPLSCHFVLITLHVKMFHFVADINSIIAYKARWKIRPHITQQG